MRIDKNNWLITKPIAHRGLWGEEIIENSIPAYKNAVENGYPIEIDVYITKDNHLVSFHDSSLKRMTGCDGFVYEKTLEELKSLRLLDSNESIPTFDEVLNIAENKIPLLIEIKNQPNKKVVDAVVARLKDYKGEFAVQSFNPLYMKRVKKLAPEFIRGVLTTANKNHVKDKFRRWIIKTMPFNFLIKPDFLSVYYGSLPTKKRKSKNKVILAWTVTDKQIEEKVKKHANNIIFENYIP
jgi:glycerophosphoryl diester phosphodiesterase